MHKKQQIIKSSRTLNGKILGELIDTHKERNFEHAKSFSFNLPENILNKHQMNTIDLEIEGANSPFNLGLSEDPRMLGMQLISLKFES